ncbi:MAG: hypothetical protein HXX12_13175 [Geothrix sp.]|uniref:hypothetical protein n=1 Tax=Geothrix sp. TaxID=1962974 RepID=UPI0018590D00|nr:hypothetical protein [Geothrix sp.]NWJ41907.1 hypothetical protein [Geothrix sp.]WIL20120.1 MAG: hypothetical protein QOZ81_002664 [Geothrix sp.]
MRVNLYQALLGTSLLGLLACNGGGDSKTTMTVTGPESSPSSTTAVFDPASGAVPLPNVLVTATTTSITYTATSTPAAGTLNINPGYPLTPDKALAYVNLKEMGNTHAVSGVNAPIYIGFTNGVDTATINGANIKIFMVTPDQAPSVNPSSYENNPLTFTDISGLFTFSTMALTPSGVGAYAMPKVPLPPGYRFLYVVTNRVKDTAGKSISASPFFEALKSTTALAGSFAALEPIRSDAMAGANIQLSGYAKVMNDLIAASATTTITQRADIALMGRFITTGAGYIPADPVGTPASRMPVETALWAYANNANLGATALLADFSTAESRAWTNGVSHFQLMGTSAIPSGAGSISAIFGSIPSAAVGFVGAGTFESADFQLDPYAVHANLANAGGNLDAITGLVYNPGTSVAIGPLAAAPGTGVLQSFRNGTGVLRGFYHRTRRVPFIVIAPITPAPVGGYPVAVFMHGIGGQKEQALGLANTLCAAGYAVVSIDQAVHGLPANGQLDVTGTAVSGSLTSPLYTGPGMGNGRPAAEWASNFFMLPSILTARTNVQTSAFNLWRLERILKQPAADPTSLQAAMTTAGKSLSAAGASQFVGQSLGSIVGSYFLAGNSSQTGGSNMKGLLSVPGARLAWILKESPSFATTVAGGLAAAGVPTGSAAFYQFFALAQAVADPIDPATMGTPLPGAPVSRFINRLLVQEAVGDTVIQNACGQYFVNAFAGRQGQLGVDVSATTGLPGFTQVLRNTQVAPAVPYVYGATLAAIKAPVAAATASSATTPTQGVMQYSPAQHGMLLQDTATAANVASCQTQMYAWVKYGLVVDGANAAGFPFVASPSGLTKMVIPGLFGPESLSIHYPLTPTE